MSEKVPTLKADCARHGRYEYPTYDEQGFHRFHQAPQPCPKCVADPLPFMSTNIYVKHLKCPKQEEWCKETEQYHSPYFKPVQQISWEQMSVVLECQACKATIQLYSFTAEVKDENPR
jgi:hypothetical protein